MTPKKLHIKTYGCQMNVYDSVRMGDLMRPFGYDLSEQAENADMVILNTCHIRERASERMYSVLGKMRELKDEKNGEMIIAVAGCVGQAEGEEIFRRAPYVDIVTGPQAYQSLPEMVAGILRGSGREINLDFNPEPKFDALPQDTVSQGVSAFLSIQEGCDKFCTFCVVPYTRGAEYSRPAADILREAEHIAASGSVEITLLGQNVNAYHGQHGETLATLIEQIAAIDGVKRIRYTTSHPRDMDEALIAAHGNIPELMPFLHLPVQSGSDSILHAMNRKHKAADYLKVIDKLRHARSDIAFSSDFIVGFPGETEKDLEDTIALVKEVGFAQAYSFKYSPRPGTPASIHEKQIPEEVKSERLARLQAAIEEQQFAFNQRSVGQTMDVLFDRDGKYPGQLIGRSPYMQSVLLNDAPQAKYSILPVTISEAYAHSVLAMTITE